MELDSPWVLFIGIIALVITYIVKIKKNNVR